MNSNHRHDVVVVGAGQAGLAAGYFLRRAGVDFVVLDREEAPGGAWQHGWDSLHLFSPAPFSTLPGWWMPPEPGRTFPTAAHTVRYLADYEKRYELPVRRPVTVRGVHRETGGLRVDTDRGSWRARIVISATGTWRSAYVPYIPGQATFAGRQLHTAGYRRPAEFAGRRVAVVGGGNSAAQILAEISTLADTTWYTLRPPRFLPDDVDGRVLFDVASRQHLAHRTDAEDTGGVAALGDIVMVPAVLAARERGVLRAQPMFTRVTRNGVVASGGIEVPCDVIVWCTGFRPHLAHLAPLGLRDRTGRVPVEGTRALGEPRLHLLGYGDWTGTASATIIGAARTAKTTVAEIVAHLDDRVDHRRP